MDAKEKADWCKKLFASIRDGGFWGVPRSGLIYSKKDGKLVLTDFMPWITEMKDKVTAEQLLEQQRYDHASNKREFGAVGVVVEDEAGLEQS